MNANRSAAPQLLAGDSRGAVAAYFAKLPSTVYDANAVPAAALTVLKRVRHEQFAGRHQLFVATCDDMPQARAIAFLADSLPGRDTHPRGFIGGFEALDQPAAAGAVLHAAANWLRQQGCREITGPIDGDIWHRYRLNLGPHDIPPLALEPQNPAYYPALWEGASFRVITTYNSRAHDDLAALTSALAPRAAAAATAGYRSRALDPACFADELTLLHELSLAVFADSPHYTPLPRDAFAALYQPWRAALVPELARFTLAPDGTPCGFFFAFPDKDPSIVHLKSMGVLAAHRRRGTAAFVFHDIYRSALDRGCRRARFWLMRDGNFSAAAYLPQSTVIRHYALYAAPAS